MVAQVARCDLTALEKPLTLSLSLPLPPSLTQFRARTPRRKLKFKPLSLSTPY